MGAGETRAHERVGLARGTWLYLACALAAVVVIGAIHYLAESRIDRATRETDERLNVSLGRTTLVNALAGVQADLTYLARHNEARGLFKPGEPEFARELGVDFVSFIEAKRLYDQVRYIDSEGNEVVRANFNAGHPALVPAAALQNKSDRYYFTDAAQLDDGAIYFSPLDLNVEKGRVEQPLKPVMRFGTPVRDENGKRSGFLFLNYLGERLINDFRTAGANIGDHILLLDEKGYWLSKPNEGNGWSFMLEHEHSFATQYPNAWARITGKESGQFTTPEGMFTFETVHPIARKPTAGIDAGSGAWKVVAHLLPGSFAVSPASFAAQHALTYSAVLIALSAAALMLARAVALRRRAESRVQFEQRFREVLENIDIMGLGLDASGTIVFCNRSLLSRLGWDRDALVGRSCFDVLVAPEDRARYEEAFNRLLTGEPAPYPTESRVVTRDGQRRLVAWECTPTGSSDGAGLTFLGKDITDARQAEERVRMLSRAIEQSPATVMITDPDGAIEYVNPKFTELTGYTQEEVKGKNPRLLKSGATAPDEYEKLWVTICAGGDWRGELQNRKKSGELYWEAATISGVRDRSGEIAHFLAVKEDITERRRLEERFRHCVEAAPCALVLADREGRMILINRSTEKLFGYSRDELLGESVERLLPDGVRERHVRHRHQFHAAPQPRAMGAGRDLRAMRRDGSTFPVEIGLIPVEDSEETELVLVSLIDMSARRRLELELAKRDRDLAESRALAAVGRMANMVAHDLRNPLSSIKMSLQIISKHHAARLSETEKELTSIALEQVRYVEEILDDLMSYSRDNGLALEWITVEKVLNAAILLVQRQIEARDVEVVTRFQGGLPTLHGDPTRLRRAFSNLIINAVQATASESGRKPKIVISTQLELAHDLPRIRVEVVDNGSGIPPELTERVFEPFYTTRASGTGLGLAIVKRIVEQHHGTIELGPAEDGVGTRVSIVLPTGPLTLETHEALSETADEHVDATAADAVPSES